MTDKVNQCSIKGCDKPAKWNVQGPGQHRADVQQVCGEHLKDALAFGTSQVWEVEPEPTKPKTDAEAMAANKAEANAANPKRKPKTVKVTD